MDIKSSFAEPVGVLLMKVFPASVINYDGITYDVDLAAMETKNTIHDDTLFMIWYSFDSHTIPSDCNQLISVPYISEQRPSFIATAAGYYGEPYELTFSDNLPTAFELYQNYPNPFNPYTVIEFALPTAGGVRLEVFNLLGQRVSTLLDRRLSAGRHSVYWDATGSDGARVASGVYFYRLSAGDMVVSKKMMLLK